MHSKIGSTSGHPSRGRCNRTYFRDWYQGGLPQEHANGSADTYGHHSRRRRAIKRMHAAAASIDQTTPAEREDQTTGRHEVAVKYFHQGEKSRREDHVDNPARANRMFEGDGSHERRAGQGLPWGRIGAGGNDDGVEDDSNKNANEAGLY